MLWCTRRVTAHYILEVATRLSTTSIEQKENNLFDSWYAVIGSYVLMALIAAVQSTAQRPHTEINEPNELNLVINTRSAFVRFFPDI